MKILISKPISPLHLTTLQQASISYTSLQAGQSLQQVAAYYDILITMLSDEIDRSFLEQNRHLKLIANYAVGYNNIDISAAKEFGIKVINTPDVLTNATADLALTLLLATSRLLLPAYKNVQQGAWRGWEPMGFLGKDLRNKTLGIFGAGRIGQRFAHKCYHALDMKIIYCSKHNHPSFDKNYHATQVDFVTLLHQSDVLSLHAPLTKETQNIMNTATFNQMKDEAIFINTARGSMHDEAALLTAVNTGKLFAAGLDVTNPEPMLPSSPLLTNPRIVVLPHIGSATEKTRNDMVKIIVDNILALQQGAPLISEIK